MISSSQSCLFSGISKHSSFCPSTSHAPVPGHLGGPPTVVTPVCPRVSCMGSPTLDTALQVLCHKSQTEERRTSLVLLASLLLLQPRMWLTFSTEDSCSACCPEGPTGLFLQRCFLAQSPPCAVARHYFIPDAGLPFPLLNFIQFLPAHLSSMSRCL